MAEWYERQPRPNWLHAIYWFLFGNGGALAAIIAPVMILVMGILGPLGYLPYWWSMDRASFAWVLANPLVKLFLLVVIFFTFWHTAHRVQFLFVELGMAAYKRLLALLWYGLAIGGTVYAAYLLVTTP